MRTIGAIFLGYVICLLFFVALFAQDKPATTTMQNDTVLRSGSVAQAQEPAKKLPTIEELKSQVTQLEQTVAQKDAQIAAMSAQLTASGKMFSSCFQSLAEAEQRAAGRGR